VATTNVESRAHRVVVIGSGFGGLFATRALREAQVAVTVIDRTNHHLFQPLLYQVATGILSPGEIAPATRDVLQRQANAEVLIGDVVDIDVARRLVVSEVLGQQTVTPYDSLIVAAGSTTSYYGHDEFADDAPSLKSIDDALELRGRIFGAFEMAELESERRRRWLTFVVVGGGATGVEMAGQIAELSRRTLRRNFRNFDPADARVVLVEGGHEILAGFGDRLSSSASAELRHLGVEIHLGAKVTGMDAGGVDIQSDEPGFDRIDAMVKVWAAGVRGASIGEIIAAKTGATLDRAGHIEVRPDCTVDGHPELFVVGDLMALDDLPGVCEVAMQSGMFAAATIRGRVEGRRAPDRFKYRDLGSMASVARFHAVASIGPFRFSGLVGWLLWVFVHLVFLTGFKNRAYTISHWTVSFIGRARSERTFTYQQVFGRQALEATHPASPPPASCP
jgi:NADH dehydrogenase